MQDRKRDTDVQNRLLDSMGGGEGGMIWENSIKTCILSSVKQIASPGWMHETSDRGWCTGMAQRDGMGRKVGGGFRMGNTCKSVNPWLIHVNVWQKPLQQCKVISLQLIKQKQHLVEWGNRRRHESTLYWVVTFKFIENKNEIFTQSCENLAKTRLASKQWIKKWLIAFYIVFS